MSLPCPPTRSAVRAPLRVGFLALNDAAPLIVAHEYGLFTRHGLPVTLSREVGWATVRDKLLYQELHAAHAPAGMLVSTKLGLGCAPTDCLTALVLSTQGNAITLSERLWSDGVRDAATLREAVRRTRLERPLVFGVVFQHGSHHLHWCDWLTTAGIRIGRGVRIVIVPPPLVFRNLLAGTIDGFCAGEPWNSVAVREKVGWCPVAGADLGPGQPEKVLMVRQDFAVQRHEEHLALVAAVAEAGRLCDQPEFRKELVRLLARREYLNVPERTITAGLLGPFDLGHGRTAENRPFVTFAEDGGCDPLPEKLDWLLDGLKRHHLLPEPTALPRHLSRELFRSDLYHQARQRCGATRADVVPAGG